MLLCSFRAVYISTNLSTHVGRVELNSKSIAIHGCMQSAVYEVSTNTVLLLYLYAHNFFYADLRGARKPGEQEVDDSQDLITFFWSIIAAKLVGSGEIGGCRHMSVFRLALGDSDVTKCTKRQTTTTTVTTSQRYGYSTTMHHQPFRYHIHKIPQYNSSRTCSIMVQFYRFVL